MGTLRIDVWNLKSGQEYFITKVQVSQLILELK